MDAAELRALQQALRALWAQLAPARGRRLSTLAAEAAVRRLDEVVLESLGDLAQDLAATVDDDDNEDEDEDEEGSWGPQTGGLAAAWARLKRSLPVPLGLDRVVPAWERRLNAAVGAALAAVGQPAVAAQSTVRCLLPHRFVLPQARYDALRDQILRAAGLGAADGTPASSGAASASSSTGEACREAEGSSEKPACDQQQEQEQQQQEGGEGPVMLPPQVVQLVGPPGMGKSMLAMKLALDLQAQGKEEPAAAAAAAFLVPGFRAQGLRFSLGFWDRAGRSG